MKNCSDHTGMTAHRYVTVYRVCSTQGGKMRWYYFPTKTAARRFVKEECVYDDDEPDIAAMKVGLSGLGIAGALNFHVESTRQNEG